VVDDGTGGDASADDPGRGGGLMTSLAKTVRGQVTIVHRGGTRCTLAIPVNTLS